MLPALVSSVNNKLFVFLQHKKLRDREGLTRVRGGAHSGVRVGARACVLTLAVTSFSVVCCPSAAFGPRSVAPLPLGAH